MNTQKLLILIDIDGTLIHPGKTPRQSLAAAIYRHTQRQINFEVDNVAGLTDPLIIRNALDYLQIPATSRDGLVGKILISYLEIFSQKYPQANDQIVYSGAFDLLNYLKEQTFRLGLITGNLEQGARIKLKPFGLMDYFSFGVFSSDHPDRDQLPAIALEKVRRQFGEIFHPENVIIIGDTVRDVLCAHRNGMRAIAVLRHPERRPAIAAENPDLMIPGFENLGTLKKYFHRLQNL
jgi:phosphoglycolate phosphatase